jgi:RNA polymerase sigma-70 factor (ECF subfamily)
MRPPDIQDAVEEDRKLVAAVKLDTARFRGIFDKYYHPIFSYALRRTLDIDTAADIAATTFARAYTAINRFEWRGIALSSWLFRIATHELAAYARKRKLRFEVRLVDAPAAACVAASLEDDRSAIEAELLAHRRFLWLQATLRRLPERYQSVLALRYFEGKGLREIAEILNRPEGTVKSLLSRGTARLRKEWGRQSPDTRRRENEQ